MIYVIDGVADPWRKKRLLSKWELENLLSISKKIPFFSLSLSDIKSPPDEGRT